MYVVVQLLDPEALSSDGKVRPYSKFLDPPSDYLRKGKASRIQLTTTFDSIQFPSFFFFKCQIGNKHQRPWPVAHSSFQIFSKNLLSWFFLSPICSSVLIMLFFAALCFFYHLFTIVTKVNKRDLSRKILAIEICCF